jgi:hypothetical protein
VDSYSRVEQLNLRFINDNQKKLRADLYKGVADAITEADVAGDDVSGRAVGRKVILPSSFPGSPRHQHKLYMDSMSVAAKFGKADFFLTMTCNPNWTEIKRELFPGQSADDRPDLVARVFRLKLKSVTDDIQKKQVLGKAIAYLHVIEFQKRGLPHAHILIWLALEDKPKTPADYDAYISAEIPDPLEQPELYRAVVAHMIHGPCGIGVSASNRPPCCEEDGTCSKHFPKTFADTTTENEDGYPYYRRRDNGSKVWKKGVELDNRWVVPYNAYFLVKYDCHMCMEYCSNIKSIKYVHKYCYKGPDRATLRLNMKPGDERNEVKRYSIAFFFQNLPSFLNLLYRYVSGRYYSSSEAAWRLLGFEMNHIFPSVMLLPIHLPNEQSVLFEEGADLRAVVASNPKSQLMAYFDNSSETPNDFLYTDFPSQFTWNNRTKEWIPRAVLSSRPTIGRMYHVPLMDSEKYYLRLLLTQCRGVSSFEALRTVNGVIHPTFQDTCIALGLLADDQEWDRALTQAADFQMPSKLRQLFVFILAYCSPSRPETLWGKHRESLCEDILYKMRLTSRNRSLQFTEAVFTQGLLEIELLLRDLTPPRSLSKFPSMPQIPNHLPSLMRRYLDVELNLDRDEILSRLETNIPLLNLDQNRVFSEFRAGIDAREQRLIFVDGPGGSGKTFLFNCMLDYTRSLIMIALATATVGLATKLLYLARTAHSRFKFPLIPKADSICNLKPNSPEGQIVIQAAAIFIDEISALHRFNLDALNRTLNDLMLSTESDEAGRLHKLSADGRLFFGGKTVVVGGDFRQTLPVVPKGTRAETVGASIRQSPLWELFQDLQLRINMRLLQNMNKIQRKRCVAFSEWLLSLGGGEQKLFDEIGNGESDRILLPDFAGHNVNSLESLIDETYPQLLRNLNDPQYFSSRSILTPLNKDASEINAMILERLPTQPQTFFSADSAANSEESSLYPVEFLNSLQLSGMPPHQLQLKVGAIVMLIRNLKGDLCNGQRLIVVSMRPNIIEVRRPTDAQDDTFFLPRITLDSANTQLPFELRRRQFPVKLAFAMTINKSQGQSLSRVGLYLPRDVFAHGQLYVAFSRATKPDAVTVFDPRQVNSKEPFTLRNVVYHEALL